MEITMSEKKLTDSEQFFMDKILELTKRIMKLEKKI